MALRIGAILLVAALALAGCTNPGDTPDSPGDGAAGPGNGGAGPGGGSAPGASPQPFDLEDGGTITGPFERSWDVTIENVAFTQATFHFGLSGLQAGAPPTARVHLELVAPDGTVVKAADAGVGATDAVDWSLTSADLSQPGTYTLEASGGDAGIPGGGLATWELVVAVRY